MRLGVTYYGTFAQTDAAYGFRALGHTDDASLVLVFDRLQGYAPQPNHEIYRPFDSTTYRIIDVRPDLQAYECDLRKTR